MIRLVRLFYVMLVCRLVLLAFILEPTNDEGLWQWNARCDVWELPSHGIQHSALSPVNHLITRVLYEVVTPSIQAKRMLNVLLVACAAGFACWRLVRSGHEMGAALLLAWLWLDPYFFRMGSWAILEPLLMAGIVVWHCLSHRNEGTLICGVLTGLLIGVKITIIWLPAGMGMYLLLARRHQALMVFSLAVMLTAAACYGLMYLVSDHARFIAIWRLHTESRTDALASLQQLVRGLPDFRSAFYTGTAILGFGWCLFSKGKNLSASAWAVLFGLAALGTQTCRPERYIFPVALLALLAALDAGLLRQSKAGILSAMLIAACAMNVFWWRSFVTAPANAGGWVLRDQLQAAAGSQHHLAAPPHLALDVRHPIRPTSSGLLSIGGDADWLPDTLIVQVTAAEPTPEDDRMAKTMTRHGAVTTSFGFYQLTESAP